MSFFREEVLETRESAFSGKLEVWYAWGKRMVNSPNVNMSHGSLDKVFREAFRKEGVLDRTWRDVLVLGLGAGNVPLLLQQRPGKFRITGVEIDPAMVALARKWFKLDEVPDLEVVESDAVKFVAACQSQYDLVVVDLFQDREVPPSAETEEFILNAVGLLRPGGRLMFNRLMHEPDLAQRTVDFTRMMEQVLPGMRYIRAHTNRMLVYEKV